MRTLRTIRPLAVVVGMLAACVGNAQVTNPSNNASSGDYVGCDNTSPFPLEIRQNDNQPIQWYTDAIQRMILTPTLTNQNWAWYQNNDLDFSGHLGIGNPTPVRPLTYLHINSSPLNGITVGYRPWMRVGALCTQGTDGLYVGMRALEGMDHAILNWSDDDDAGPDPMCFVFTSTPDNATTANMNAGLEIARMIPDVGGNEGYFGVGDFFTPGLNPTERLDILHGRLRIRQLPEASGEATDTYKVMVVDDTSDPLERGVVKWADVNLSANCDWVVQNPEPHVSNTYNGSNCSWGQKHGVGIGVEFPKSKLYVYHNDNALLSPIAISADSRFDLTNGQQLYGLHSQARPTASTTFIVNQRATGVFGVAVNSRSSVGVHGSASVCQATEGTASQVVGVKAEASGCDRANFVAGVYASGSGAIDPANEWAAYFTGRGYLASGPWQPSDQQLKTNIQPMAVDALDGVDPMLSLPVHSYEYNVEAFPSMHLPLGQQVGFLAQELEALIPSAVSGITHPAETDSLGNETTPSVDFKAINPIALIPYLVLTVQRQQATIDQFAELLAACCAGPNGTGARDAIGLPADPVLDPALDPARDSQLRIVPNPFSEPPTVYYTLQRSGRMQLIANSSDGKALQVLQEASMEAGSYQFNWNTAELAPGMYYVTLLLDGQPLVKKAIKVTR